MTGINRKTCDWCTTKIPKHGELHELIGHADFIVCSQICRKQLMILNKKKQ